MQRHRLLLHFLWLAILLHGSALIAKDIVLTEKNGKLSPYYDSLLSHEILKEGDQLIFLGKTASDDAVYRFECILGCGKTTRTIAVGPERALRIPLSNDGKDANFIDQFVEGHNLLNGVNPKHLLKIYRYRPKTFVEVDRVIHPTNVEPRLLGTFYSKNSNPNFELDELSKEILEGLVPFSEAFASYAAVGDFSLRQTLWNRERVILVDHANNWRHFTRRALQVADPHILTREMDIIPEPYASRIVEAVRKARIQQGLTENSPFGDFFKRIQKCREALF